MGINYPITHIKGQKNHHENEKSDTFSYLCVMKKVNLNNPMPKGLHLDYQDHRLVLMDNVHNVSHTRETVINESFIVMMVEEGEAQTTINNSKVTLATGDILICSPGIFLERGMVDITFHCIVFIISANHIGEILKGTHMSLSHYLLKKRFDILHLTPEEQNIIRKYYHLISALGKLDSGKAREESINLTMRSFAYAFAGLFISRGATGGTEKHTSAETLFHHFVRLLKEHPDGRTVQFYADKLNITPKYFNTICKQVSGKTASTLINEELVNTAKMMLRDPDLSIKQVSSMLGFANQSHFGSFIRRSTGISPQALRKNSDL